MGAESPSSPHHDASEPLLQAARMKLVAPQARDLSLAALAAAAFFAFSALAFATAAVLAPPLVLTPAAKPGVR